MSGGAVFAVLKKKSTKILCLLCVIVIALVAVCAVYLGDFYHADMESIRAFAPAAVKQYRNDNGDWVFEPDETKTGFIFYPGGKVEHSAYIPLMEQLASENIFCVLVEMPFRLAVLDIDAADRVVEQYPQIERWYIGGHSLGGAMAASYLSDRADKFEGLVLLGAYSAADLSKSGLSVLSVYGSEDRVLDTEAYARNKGNLPEEFTEIVIDGGCHSYFGMYGIQNGDGTPTIANEEQIILAAEAIVSMLGGTI